MATAKRNPTTAKRKPKVRIPVRHEGVLKIPKGKKFWQMPMSHYDKLVGAKGYASISRALTNLEVFNRKKDPTVAARASRIADQLRKKYRPELAARPHKSPRRRPVKRNQLFGDTAAPTESDVARDEEQAILAQLPPAMRKRSTIDRLDSGECLIHVKDYTVPGHTRKCPPPPRAKTKGNPRPRKSYLSKLGTYLKKKLKPAQLRKLAKDISEGYKRGKAGEPEPKKRERSKLVEVRKYEAKDNPRLPVHIETVENFYGGKPHRFRGSVEWPNLDPGEAAAKIGDLVFFGYLSARDGKPTLYIHGTAWNGFEHNQAFLDAIDTAVQTINPKTIHGIPLYLAPDNRSFLFQAKKGMTARGVDG